MKRTVAVIASVGSLVVSALLVRESWTMPDASEIASRTPEDILGYGYMLSWVVVALIEACLVVVAIRFTPERHRRLVAVALICVFAAASVAGLLGYRRQMALVLGTEDASLAKALFF